MRKLRRKQELQDKRDRIRMGLLPPDPPKGKILSSEGCTFQANLYLFSSLGEFDEGLDLGRCSRPNKGRSSRQKRSGYAKTYT